MIDDMESITAKLCSFARAYHSNHEKNKIFDDYLAYDLMGKEEYDEIGQLIEHEYDKTRFDLAYNFSGKRIRDKLNRYISPIPLSRAAFAERELTHGGGAEESGIRSRRPLLLRDPGGDLLPDAAGF